MNACQVLNSKLLFIIILLLMPNDLAARQYVFVVNRKNYRDTRFICIIFLVIREVYVCTSFTSGSISSASISLLFNTVLPDRNT